MVMSEIKFIQSAIFQPYQRFFYIFLQFFQILYLFLPFIHFLFIFTTNQLASVFFLDIFYSLYDFNMLFYPFLCLLRFISFDQFQQTFDQIIDRYIKQVAFNKIIIGIPSILSFLSSMQQIKPSEPPRKFKMYRRPSSNTSIESSDSSFVLKKEYIMEKNEPSSKQDNHSKKLVVYGLTKKLKICDGEKLSYEVIQKDSKQKRSQFLQKYIHDPFMRKKFEKSVEKLNRSNSRQQIPEKKPSSVMKGSRKILPNQAFTTFREQIIQQSQKTVKLINNCRQLVDELKKNRVTETQLNTNIQINDRVGRRFSHLEIRR